MITEQGFAHTAAMRWEIGGAPAVQPNIEPQTNYGAVNSKEESLKEMYFSCEGRLNRKAAFERMVVNGICCRILEWFIAEFALELNIIGIIISLVGALVLFSVSSLFINQ